MSLYRTPGLFIIHPPLPGGKAWTGGFPGLADHQRPADKGKSPLHRGLPIPDLASTLLGLYQELPG